LFSVKLDYSNTNFSHFAGAGIVHLSAAEECCGRINNTEKQNGSGESLAKKGRQK
jgi:hypothetical protein